jgi:hypothetical protein
MPAISRWNLSSAWRAAGDDLRLADWRRVFYTHVQAAPANGISQSALLVARQNNKGNALRFHRAELRNRQLPGRKDFKQHRLETFVYLVEFINQENTRPLAFKRAHQRTRPEEGTPLEVRLHALPIPVRTSRKLHIEPLQPLIESPDGLVLGYAAVALQPLNMRPGCGGNRDGQLRFARSCGPFEQQWFLQLGGEKDHLGHHRVDEVPRGREFGAEIVD